MIVRDHDLRLLVLAIDDELEASAVLHIKTQGLRTFPPPNERQYCVSARSISDR